MCSCYANIKLRRKRFKISLAAFRHRVSPVCHEESTVYADGGMIMHRSIPPAPSPSPPGLLRGICPPCQSPGWGICKFCTAQGPGICQPPGHSRAFDTHAVSYQNITTQKVLLEKTQIGSSVKDRKKL